MPHAPRPPFETPAPIASGGDVRDCSGDAGGFTLELIVGDRCVATASATPEVLRDMSAMLGVTAEDARSISEAVLRAGKDTLTLSVPRPTDKDGSRFASSYVMGRGGKVTLGVVWYDTSSSMTGPSESPEEVRREMRVAVTRLFAPTGMSEPLVNAFLQWHSVLAEQKPNVDAAIDAVPAGNLPMEDDD